MTTFKFNFSGENDIKTATEIKEDIEWLESEEVMPDKQIKALDTLVTHANMFTCGDVEIGHVMTTEAISKIESRGFLDSVTLAENKHSDLVAGIYEGGLKIWECTSDVVEYFEDNKDRIAMKSLKVLDLGCGAGILGIYTFMNGADVTFQDYNKDVLEYVTIPNVLLNIEEEERESEIKRCKFYSGDWESFNSKCQEEFDIIITSETIYNESNYSKLITLFLDKLSNKGTLYLAAKTYYFGVGGGTRQFEKTLKDNGLLTSEVCWKSTGGIQREILKISKKSPA